MLSVWGSKRNLIEENTTRKTMPRTRQTNGSSEGES